MALGNPLEARRFVGEYLQCFPSDENALFLDVKYAMASQNKLDALVELSKLIELNPSNSEYLKLRGETYYHYEMWQNAFYDFSMALDINARDAELNYFMGRCKFRQESVQKACFYWRRAAGSKSREAAEMFYQYCEE